MDTGLYLTLRVYKSKVTDPDQEIKFLSKKDLSV